MLTEIFRNGKKKLNPTRIYESRTELLLAGTRADTGELELFDAKAVKDIVELIRLSIAVPGAYAESVEYNGLPYTDGAVAEPLPIKAALNLFPKATDVLIISNLPEGRSSFPEIFIKTLLERSSITQATAIALANHDQSYEKSLQEIRGDKTRRYLIMRPNKALMSHARTTEELEHISRTAENALLAQFELSQAA
jgi:predicted patatin/cPLA2 family phospholipase